MKYTTPLEYRVIDKWKYYTTKEHKLWIPELAGLPPVMTEYYSLVDGWLTANLNYAWNGANHIKDSPDLMIPSLFHDLGYQMMRLGQISKSWRKLFDDIFRDLYKLEARRVYLQEHKTMNWRKQLAINTWAVVIHAGVRAGGWATLNRANYPEEQVIEI